MTTAMGGVTGATITAIKNGVANIMGMGVIVLDISNRISTRNLSTSIHQCTIRHSNRPASVCFFRLIFVDRCLENITVSFSGLSVYHD